MGYRSVVGTSFVAGGEMCGMAAALMLADDVLARPGFLQRVIDCTDRVDTGPAPGPDRAQLLELAS